MNPDRNTDQGVPRPRLGNLFRLQWEAAQNAHVLLYPEGMVRLNASASQILLRCDGTRSVQAIVAELEAQFNVSGLAPEVDQFLNHARERGWID